MSAAYPRRSKQVLGDAMDAQSCALLLTSCVVLSIIVILAAFIRYLWIVLAICCALPFLLPCASRTFAARQSPAAQGQQSHGGLSMAAIATVAPGFPYSDGEEQCAVCLEELHGGEAARQLPACALTFHVGCIDMWLDSHATCPSCRCHVVPPHKGSKEQPEATLPPV